MKKREKGRTPKYYLKSNNIDKINPKDFSVFSNDHFPSKTCCPRLTKSPTNQISSLWAWEASRLHRTLCKSYTMVVTQKGIAQLTVVNGKAIRQASYPVRCRLRLQLDSVPKPSDPASPGSHTHQASPSPKECRVS